MTRSTLTISRLLLLLVLAAAGMLPTAGAPAQSTELSDVRVWADHVWESAKRGEREALQRFLDEIPDQADPKHRQRLVAAVEQSRANARQADQQRHEARSKALQEMRSEIEDGKLSAALRSAVHVQTLSDDMTAALGDPEIRQAVQWADQQIPEELDNGDWLLAQELLFRLRTLYEDTGRYEQFAEYDEQLERVNRRVALLAEYAPRRLTELRRKQIERTSPDVELPEFNPEAADDWRDRVEGIEVAMIRLALRKAAQDHIEGRGWRPLLEGGLEAMKLVATTSALGETFPSLENAEDVERWVSFIDAKLAELEARPDDRLSKYYTGGVIDKLVERNEQTIQLPRPVLYREFANGAMHSLDEYSEMIWPHELRRFEQSTEGHFVGVGILISHNEKREIKVVTPLEGSPAYFADVRPDDRIAAVDGESTVGWSLNDAVDKITGPRGTTVTLGIRREGEEDLVQIPIERDLIKIHSVKGWWKRGLDDDGNPAWDWFVDPTSRIAYLRLTSFSDDTFVDLLVAWDQITDRGRRPPNGLILDLRYNPGGLLRAAVEISNLFVRDGAIVAGEDNDSHEEWRQEAQPNRARIAEDDVPTVVLINEGSASASEIVAGCLQAHDAALVVGRRSFGKGSVQTVHPLTIDARLKLTTQYYRLPPTEQQRRRGVKGRLVHRRSGARDWGVNPDILVAMTPEQIEESIGLRRSADLIAREPKVDEEGHDVERPDVADLIEKGLDPQLETALLILQAKVLGKMTDERKHAKAG